MLTIGGHWRCRRRCRRGASTGHSRSSTGSIAAAAEARGLAVLHYDADFELVGAITGQATEWIVERGTAD